VSEKEGGSDGKKRKSLVTTKDHFKTNLKGREIKPSRGNRGNNKGEKSNEKMRKGGLGTQFLGGGRTGINLTRERDKRNQKGSWSLKRGGTVKKREKEGGGRVHKKEKGGQKCEEGNLSIATPERKGSKDTRMG